MLLQALGYAGFIPFLLLTVLVWWPVFPAFDALAMFQRYSAIILAFMAGVLWPIWSQQAPFKPLALFAVTLPVLSFFAGVLPDSALLIVESLLFLALRLAERWFGLDLQYHPAYLQLRNRLTVVVVSCHLLLLWHLLQQ